MSDGKGEGQLCSNQKSHTQFDQQIMRFPTTCKKNQSSLGGHRTFKRSRRPSLVKSNPNTSSGPTSVVCGSPGLGKRLWRQTRKMGITRGRMPLNKKRKTAKLHFRPATATSRIQSVVSRQPATQSLTSNHQSASGEKQDLQQMVMKF